MTCKNIGEQQAVSKQAPGTNESDIAIVRRIKQLVRHDKMTFSGAARVLSRELLGEGRPKTNQEAIGLVDELERDVRQLLDRMDNTDKQIRRQRDGNP